MGGHLKLGQILVSKGLISPEQLASALGEQQETQERLGATLVRMGVVNEETLIQVLAGQLRLPVARIRGKKVGGEVLQLVPVELAEKHRCMPLFVREEDGGRVLMLAMEDPSDSDVVDEIAFHVGMALRPVLVAASELEDALQRHYHTATLMPAESSSLPPIGGGAAPAPEPVDEVETEPDLPLAPPVLDPNLEPEGDGSELASGLDDLGDDPFGSLDDDLGGFTSEPFSADSAPRADDGRDAGLGAPQAAAPRSGDGETLDPGVILRALAQLLVEKGVIDRDEFAARLREVAARSRA